MSSNKEEDDKAWWSDYQASTKLKRKWNKQKKSDHDDLDDILGDLDDIVNKPDVKAKVSKEKKCDSDDDIDDIVSKPNIKVVSTDVQHSKTNTIEDRGKNKSEEGKESDVDNKSLKEEKLFEKEETHEKKNLVRVDTKNKNIEKEIKGEEQNELEVKTECIQDDVVIKGKQVKDNDSKLKETSECGPGTSSCAAGSSLSGRPQVSKHLK